jgi:hypothetical protein
MKNTSDVRHKTTLGNRFRFLTRVLGLLALLIVPMGLLLTHDVQLPWAAGFSAVMPQLTSIVQGGAGLAAQIGGIAILAGGAVLVIVAITEVLSLFFMVTGQRTLLGVNTLVQIAAAVLLLVVVNAVSFRHYYRHDATRDQRFTLSPEIVAELKRLRANSPTTIVVLRQSKSAGLLNDKPDAYDLAAENKVVEKVNDLVAQLREFGPQFQVVELNTQNTGFERQVKELTSRRPGLAQAIATAPENTILFYADEKVQSRPRAEADRLNTGIGPRPATLPDPTDTTTTLIYPANVARMPFRDFYQLDKTSSREATDSERLHAATVAGPMVFAPGAVGQGNLVLIHRGPEAFVRKLLTLEERKPKIGLAVIHPLLTSRETVEDYTSAGLRTALERNGFEVTDIILKKWSRSGPPQPTATTFEESELDRSEARYNLLNLAIANRELVVRELTKDLKLADDSIAAADNAKELETKRKLFIEALKVVQGYVRARITSDAELKLVVASLRKQIDVFKTELTEFQTQVGEAGTQYRDLLRNERAVESRRITDVKAKLAQYVNETDLLIVPRLTVTDIVRGDTIPASIFNLSKDQAIVVQEFLKAGKPVLFAMGPILNEPRSLGEGPDDIEKLLPQFGILPGRQTILTDDEALAIAERQGEGFGVAVKLTPLTFEALDADGKKPNPISAAYRTTARAVDKKLDLKKAGYRPIYLAPGVAERSAFTPEIAFTGRTSFNEENPLMSEDTPPKYEPAKADDPKRGTRDEERRGPFTVGVAVESSVPADWFDKPDAKLKTTDFLAASAFALPFDMGLSAAMMHLSSDAVVRPKVRLVVLGHGGLFNGNALDPAQETLLLHTLNWQLKRDAALPAEATDATRWQFPRADLTAKDFFVWRWATFLGLPAAIAVLGLIALMIRKVR